MTTINTNIRIDSFDAFAKIMNPNVSMYADMIRHLTIEEIRHEVVMMEDTVRTLPMTGMHRVHRFNKFINGYNAVIRAIIEKESR